MEGMIQKAPKSFNFTNHFLILRAAQFPEKLPRELRNVYTPRLIKVNTKMTYSDICGLGVLISEIWKLVFKSGFVIYNCKSKLLNLTSNNYREA